VRYLSKRGGEDRHWGHTVQKQQGRVGEGGYKDEWRGKQAVSCLPHSAENWSKNLLAVLSG